MVRKTNPNIPYSLNDFPSVLPQVKFFTKEPITHEIKAFVGWDGIVIFDKDLDILQTLKMYAKQYQNYAQSCGRCTPGKYGGKVLYELLEKIQNYSYLNDDEALRDIEKLREVCELMVSTSKCEVGKTTPKPILQILESNPEVFARSLPNNIESENQSKFYSNTLNELSNDLMDSAKKLQQARDFAARVHDNIINGTNSKELMQEVMQKVEEIKEDRIKFALIF